MKHNTVTMNMKLFSCTFLTIVGFAISGQITNNWVRLTSLDGFLASPGTIQTTRSRLQCGMKCDREPACQSFFFNSGQQTSNCHLHKDIFLTSSNMVSNLTATYFIPANYNQQSSSNCSMNDNPNNDVILSDNMTFVYKYHTELATYEQAVNACTAENGNLVRITTAAKLEAIRTTLLECNGYVYVDGMYDSGQYYFSNEEVSVFPDVFWAPREPWFPWRYPCIELTSYHYWYAWSNFCTNMNTFICEIQV